MQSPAVLVVGAGALGVVTGYHLALGGADITFLVRPGRQQALRRGQTLYCLDDLSLKQFSGYHCMTDVADVAGNRYDFVLLTLDGASCRSEEGEALLRDLGEAIADSEAVVVVCGMDVREFCRERLGLPPERVLEGTQRLLSYPVDRAPLELHPPADPQLQLQADFSYRHSGGTDGFTIVKQPKHAAERFASLYNACGVSVCRSMGAGSYTMLTRSFFPVIAAFEHAGWPDAQALVNDSELLALTARAMREILALPEHGWRGKLVALLMGPRALAKTLTGMERNCRPLDYTAFNRFHHGDKVRQQNLQVMRHCAQSGKAQGRSMPALEQLIEYFASPQREQHDEQ